MRGCHPFRRSRSHFEEADDRGTPQTVREVRFERTTLSFLFCFFALIDSSSCLLEIFIFRRLLKA